MINFNFCNTTEIIFGKGRENEVGKYASMYGKKVLLHYGGGSIKKTGLYDKVVRSLNDSGMEIFELGGVKPNPRLSLIREGIEICRNENVDLILAVGGGSAIDSAKGIAIGVFYEGDVWDFYLKKLDPEKALPIGTILTIPAAGSEASPASVVTNEEGWFKKDVVNPCLYPKFSILNPELCFTLPKDQISIGASDIIAHQYERYFTPTKNVELTDRMLESVLKTIINNAPIALKNQNDYDAWSEIMLGGCFGHNNSLGAGRAEDWASHMIEHELSGIYDVAHGAGLAVIFPAWMKYVYKNDLDRFAQFAVRVWNVENDYFDKEKTALAGIDAYEKFLISMELPVRLSDIGIGSDRFEEMALKATNDGAYAIGSFAKLQVDDIVNIYKLAE
jgi:alcohol dehydrogenase YqhD (iron-dependent ADH family)